MLFFIYVLMASSADEIKTARAGVISDFKLQLTSMNLENHTYVRGK